MSSADEPVVSGPENQAELPVQVVRTIGRTLWRMNLETSDQKLPPDQLQGNWLEHRGSFIKAARRIVRRLEKEGYTIAKTAEG